MKVSSLGKKKFFYRQALQFYRAHLRPADTCFSNFPVTERARKAVLFSFQDRGLKSFVNSTLKLLVKETNKLFMVQEPAFLFLKF